MFFSTIKLKSREDKESKTCPFFKIKQAVFGSKVTPFPTQVPELNGS